MVMYRGFEGPQVYAVTDPHALVLNVKEPRPPSAGVSVRRDISR